MEQENKRLRKKYEVAERKRLFTLFERAYDNDPRIQKELAEVEAEKQRKKDENQAKKKQAKQAKHDVMKAAEDKKKADEQAKIDQVAAEKEARKNKAIAYKQGLKELATLCQETLPGTNYDRFWVESAMPKIRTIERCQQLIDDLKVIGESDSENKPMDFQTKFNEMMGIVKKQEEIEA